LDNALELFREKGFEHVTVDQITRRAAVAKGSFYYENASYSLRPFSSYRVPPRGMRIFSAISTSYLVDAREKGNNKEKCGTLINRIEHRVRAKFPAVVLPSPDR
jgi:hypothetical protein